jgi:hypothetical protein
MDCYDYMLPHRDCYKYRRLVEDRPPPRRRRRQCDVSKGQPLADIARTLGHAERSRITGESFDEFVLRKMEKA